MLIIITVLSSGINQTEIDTWQYGALRCLVDSRGGWSVPGARCVLFSFGPLCMMGVMRRDRDARACRACAGAPPLSAASSDLCHPPAPHPPQI